MDGSTLIKGGVVGGFAEVGNGNADIVSNNTVSVTDSQISIIAGAFSNEYDVNRNIVNVLYTVIYEIYIVSWYYFYINAHNGD